jgi:hypothetical protein
VEKREEKDIGGLLGKDRSQDLGKRRRWGKDLSYYEICLQVHPMNHS